MVVTGFKSDALQARIKALHTDVAIELAVNPNCRLFGNSHSLLLGLQAAKTDVMVFDGDLLLDPSILIEFAIATTNAFAVEPSSVDDFECAKAPCEADNPLKRLIDKRALIRADLETYRFASEAMRIIHLDNTLRQRLIATARSFLDTPENRIKD